MNDYEKYKNKIAELLKTPINSEDEVSLKILYFEKILKEFQENERKKFMSQLLGDTNNTEINIAEITGHDKISELVNIYSKINK